MNEKILVWLQSEEKDFDQGYLLLAKVLKNQSILHYLQRKRDQAKLEYELLKLAPVITSKESTEGVKATSNQVLNNASKIIEKHDSKLKVVQSGQVNYDELPAVLKPIYDVTISKYKEMRSVHEKMKLVASDEERAELRKTLDELDNEIEAGWTVIDAWIKTGALPEVKTAVQAIDFKAVNAARTYVSRAIEKAETTTGKKLEKLVADLQSRVDVLIAAKAEIKPETWEKLEKLGITAPVADAPAAESDLNAAAAGSDETGEKENNTTDGEETKAPVAE